MNKITLILLLSSLSLSCGKKSLWDLDTFHPDCDGVKTVELSKSVNHLQNDATYQQGEELSYTMCPTPSPCGGGDYSFSFTEIDCNGKQIGNSYEVKSWIEDCFTGRYLVSAGHAQKISIKIKNLNGQQVFYQEFAAESD